MKYKEKPIQDDEIRVIGGDRHENKKQRGWLYVLLVAGLLAIGALLWWVLSSRQTADTNTQTETKVESMAEPGYFEPTEMPTEQPATKQPLAKVKDDGHGFIEISDTVINDIPLQLYLPHQVHMSLYIGAVDRNDPSILFAAQAADVRADNGGIVGAFVLEGEPLAWGLSKLGYCAIINDTVTVGVADNSPLFEEATEKGGYFFRQFPLVDNGRLVENEPKGKSIRRAICDRNGEIFIAGSNSEESFHDFAQALVDLGIDHAIYLVGSNSYGWAVDAEGQRQPFGNPDPPKKKWENISYLLMREAK